MRRSVWCLVCAVGLGLAVSGCGDDGGSASPDGGGLDGGGDAGDGGPRTFTQLTYTPTGCSYEVSTPEVMEASRSIDAVGTAQPAPNHVHVSYAGPTDSTFAVNWHTDVDTKLSYVLYGSDETAVDGADGPDTGVTQQEGHTLVYGSGLAGTEPVRVHEAHVCGLDPDTRYFYKVGGPGHWSAVHEVSTGPTIGSTAPWSFAVTGDSRNSMQNGNPWPMLNRALYEAGVDLQVFTGDAVFLGFDQNGWDEFFEASDMGTSVEDVLAQIPFMAANGNHEDLAMNYIAQFAFPQEVSPSERGTGEEWYSFDYANAHFAVLNDTVDDSAILSGDEADWLDADLAAVDRAKTPWVFIVHHRPYYTCMSTHGRATDLEAWQTLVDEHHVDMVLNGHNHVYERSKPMRGGAAQMAAADGAPLIDGVSGEATGTIYVVEGGAGAPLYDVASSCDFTDTAQKNRSWVEIAIEDRTLTFTAHDLLSDGTLDSFTYTK